MQTAERLERLKNLSPAKHALLMKALEKEANGGTRVGVIPRRPERGAAPLSPGQRQMYIVEQLEGETPAYNVPLALRLTGPLDVAALERSFAEIVKRHEVLRTTFSAVGKEPVQIIAPTPAFDMFKVDLQELSAAEREAEAQRLIACAARLPFDLANGPLLRVILLRLTVDDRALGITMHHIIADEWSLGVLVDEIVALYRAFCAEELSPLPELPIQYADFAAWQCQRLEGEALENLLSYWRRQLAGSPAILELPTDHPRPTKQSFRGAVHSRMFPASLSTDIETLSSEAEVTLFMTLLAAFATLLHRYTGQDDIVVGTNVANRNRIETERLIGYFLNTLVLRIDLSGNVSFQQLLGRVERTTLGAFDHRELPFEKLVGELAPKRDLSRTSLVQLMFVFRSAPPIAAAELPELRVSRLEAGGLTSKFDLTLAVSATSAGLAAAVEYATDIFDGATAQRLLGHLKTLLSRIAANPGQCLSHLPLLTAAETQQLLFEWNAKETGVKANAFISEFFEAQVERTPEAVAVIFGEQALSYRQLDARSNQLAHRLRKLKVGPDVPVGLCLERSPRMVVAVLGTLKAGGVYVPMDPAYPKERLVRMLDDSQAPVLVIDEATVQERTETLSGLGAELVCLDAAWRVLAGQSRDHFRVSLAPENLFYIIYTSGSTGRPKGIGLSHGALHNLLEWFLVNQLTRSRTLQFASLSFDVSFTETMTTLCTGGTLVLIREDLRRNLDCVARLLAEERIEKMVFPPILLHQLAERDPSREVLHLSLKEITSTGEQLYVTPQVARFVQRLGGCSFHNHYGPSETHVVTAYTLSGSADAWPSQPPLGRLIDNARGYVLDRWGRLTAVGVPGELFVGDRCPARGYLNRPALTAEKFVPDPFAGVVAEPGSRLFRSGDLVRALADGNLQFLERIDHQVKIRGYRVELGEVESLLGRHSGVGQCVVVAREARGGSKELVAYVVPQKERRPSSGELRDFLQQGLPDYMVPSVFVMLPSLPLTPNRKIDRRALPAPDETRPELAQVYVAPRNLPEELLAGVWARLFEVDQVGIHDDFFELGGNSLLAVQLMARLREAFQVEVSLNVLFESPTVAGLAQRMAQGETTERERASVVPTPKVVPDPDQRFEPFPLTDLQEAYWMGRMRAFDLGNVSAHGYREFDFAGFELNRFQRALQRLIEHHEMLHAIVLPDGWQQILREVPDYRIEVLDLREQEPELVAAQLEAVRRQMANEGPNIDGWPLFECRVSLLDGRRVRLHLSVSLLIADGWSSRLLHEDLVRLYEDPGASLPPTELSFRDYVLALSALEGSPMYQLARDYWMGRLEALPPPPELPMARSPDALLSPRFVRRTGRLEPDAWLSFKRRAARLGVTTTVALCSLYAQVLAVWSRQPRFTLNLLFHNRLPLHPQVGEVVGNFSSTTFLEIDYSFEETFGERALRLQKQLWADLEHSHFGGVRVLRELNRMQGATLRAGMPVVFSSTLGFQRQAPATEGEKRKNGSTAAGMGAVQTPQVWLDHRVLEEGGSLVYNWDVVEELFPGSLVQDMFDAYRLYLKRLAGEEMAWQEINPQLVPQIQIEQRAAANATEAPIPPGLLHTLFGAQVARRADQQAVVAADRKLTYDALHRCANQVGRRLRELGAQPNSLVAVVMEKGWEQVVAVLGVLASGAAYLPIDPTLPKQRRWYLLEQGEVRLALVQSWLNDELEWPAGVRRFSVDDAETAHGSGRPLEPVQSPGDLAYVMYTSGSTGLPKGVMIDHRGAVNTIADINRRLTTGAEDRILALSSLSFDLSVYDIFGTLAAGATIIVPDARAVREPGRWAELVAREKVTIWNSVPALMEMLVSHLEGRGEPLSPSLRLVLLSGDWIPVGLPDRIRSVVEDVEITSLGGATEASIWSILYHIEDVDLSWTSIPYGRPLTNQSFHVLDGALEPRPVWVPGELFIGGTGLAKGYWRDEERSRASFITHPRTGERLYRTGDIGRYLPDGSIEFLGREDFQVKIQGYRIELGEIEAALAEHPAIHAQVVTAVGEHRGAKRLVAYVVPDPQETLPLTEIQSFLGAKLPDFMVPATIVALDALPLSPNGKVDRGALPAPDRARQMEEAPVLPRDELELRLVQIWEETLETEPIGVRDDFFDLGGHSLSAVRLMTRIEETLATELSLSILFEATTVERLAKVLRDEWRPGI